MRHRCFLVVPIFMLACHYCPSAEVQVRCRTESGDIIIAVDTLAAPATSANFLRYVDRGLYNNGVFHRTVRLDNQPHNNIKIEVIQGSIDPSCASEEFPPIALERTSVTGLRHYDGVVSMARAEPNSATSDFFICISDQPELDFGGQRNADGQGFAAFARVRKGMQIVRRIQSAPADGQRLTPPVHILEIKRIH
jgi:peptidyl-prolyl cis-trans isomerase A (cyclophilin A)